MKTKHPALAREGDVVRLSGDTIFQPDGKTPRRGYKKCPVLILSGPFENNQFWGHYAWIVLSESGVGVRYFIKDTRNDFVKHRETHL